jgi:flagellar L-ring protein precursor FlgH
MQLLINLFLMIFIFFGCAERMEPKMDFVPPEYVQELPPKEDDIGLVNQGSLFGRGKNPLFTDRKAMKVNDILTVVISENTTSSSVTQKNLSRTNKGQLGGGIVSGIPLAPISPLSNMGFESSSVSNYTGSGTLTRDEKFETTVTVRVIKILSNGNYFIDGKRELLIDGEKQIIQLSGVISPYDIDANNQINSKYISDAKIMYVTQGELKETTKRGWLTRFLDFVWPF